MGFDRAMNLFRLLLRNLAYYWRTNLAVLLGVVAATAVIGGAFIVGDSVRGSLRAMTLVRLHKVDFALSGGRFVREQLAADLSAQPEFQAEFEPAAPAIAMRGSLEFQQSADGTERTRRAGGVNVYGVDERLWQMLDTAGITVPTDNQLVLNARAAEQLSAKVGDDVSVWIEVPSAIPRDSLLGERDENSTEVALTVSAIIQDEHGAARFDLNPSQQLPLTAYVALGTLQAALGLDEVAATPREPVGMPARVNAIFVTAKQSTAAQSPDATAAALGLNRLTAQSLNLSDLALRLVKNESRGYVSLESEQMILEESFAHAAELVAQRLRATVSPVMVYLANEITNVSDPAKHSMYSVVAGIDFATLSASPFGPLEFVGTPPSEPLGPNDIIVNEWLAQDIAVQPGDKLHLKYHLVGSHGELPEEERDFTVRGILKLDGTPADDRGFTPYLKGVTDAKSFDDWDQPFPMQLERVTDRDDEYWDRYRATPKSFVALAAAQELWGSRYGKLTSIRVAPLPDKSVDETADMFSNELLRAVTPLDTRLMFNAVKWTGLQAASGTTDFSGLFIGFSFFLILSAAILISLLFRLGIERRASSIGLLTAIGLSPKSIRRLFLAEGLLVVVIGGLLGTLAAVAYAALMVHGLKTWWIGAIGTRFLDVYVTPQSLAMGFVISVVIATVVVLWSLRSLRKIAPRDLLAGQTETTLSASGIRRRARWAQWIALASAAGAIVLLLASLAGVVPAKEAFSGFSWQVVTFFLVGVLVLVASLAGLSAWLDADKSIAVRGTGLLGVARLAARNAARHRQRSVLTVGLIASATFVIVAIAAGRRNPAVEQPVMESGNGGYTLVGETTTPILYDLNTAAGREKLDLTANATDVDRSLIESTNVMSFRVQPGEDASCLNIYQTRLPTILGVPPAMIERGGFKFADTPAENPWTMLTLQHEDGSIPVLGDMNTLMYSLHKGIGQTIPVPNAEDPEYVLRIVGMLDGSVFQGVLLMSEENFQRLYPDRAGYEYFLIETPTQSAGQVSALFESALSPYGFDAERVAERLANFLAVQNTYLSTFLTLGGLGLLLGTLGLATVMLRNVLERRGEIALLRAVGFRNSSLSWLVLCENALLLVWGLIAGTIAASLAMAPHLRTTGADVPWATAIALLLGVFIVGMAAALFAVGEAIRTPLLSSLRSE